MDDDISNLLRQVNASSKDGMQHKVDSVVEGQYHFKYQASLETTTLN